MRSLQVSKVSAPKAALPTAPLPSRPSVDTPAPDPQDAKTRGIELAADPGDDGSSDDLYDVPTVDLCDMLDSARLARTAVLPEGPDLEAFRAAVRCVVAPQSAVHSEAGASRLGALRRAALAQCVVFELLCVVVFFFCFLLFFFFFSHVSRWLFVMLMFERRSGGRWCEVPW
jgi:hypothetical protein